MNTIQQIFQLISVVIAISINLPTDNAVIYSNLFDLESKNEVLCELSNAGVKQEKITTLNTWLEEYKKIQKNSVLPKGFFELDTTAPLTYDSQYVDNWYKQQISYNDVNCRITAFMLFEDYIHCNATYKGSTNNLLIDLDTIDNYKIINYTKENKNKFISLFSEIPAEKTQDQNLHYKNIISTWKERDIRFEDNENISIINVFIHNLMDDILFVGHSAILVSTDYGYLLFDKYSPSEPYEAFRCTSKQDVYNILNSRLNVYNEIGGSKPIYMENDKFLIDNI